MRICSACLLGICCSNTGKHNLNLKIKNLLNSENIIPICPEQLGGLPTPRSPAEIRNNKVITKDNKNLTKHFKKGAREVLKICILYKIKKAILKQRSPSCGFGQIYDGTFSKTIIKGNGMTADLLAKNGISILTEENF